MENWSNSRVMMIPQCVNNGIIVFKKFMYVWILIVYLFRYWNIQHIQKKVCLFV